MEFSYTVLHIDAENTKEVLCRTEEVLSKCRKMRCNIPIIRFGAGDVLLRKGEKQVKPHFCSGGAESKDGLRRKRVKAKGAAVKEILGAPGDKLFHGFAKPGCGGNAFLCGQNAVSGKSDRVHSDSSMSFMPSKRTGPEIMWPPSK